MKIQIDSLTGLVQTPDLPVGSLSPQRQERILNMTKQKIKAAKKQHRRSRRSPLRLTAIIAAALILLCGSVCAAYQFELFDFSRLFGENAEVIEEAIVTYEPEPDGVVSAFTGRNETNFAKKEDYNFQLRGSVDVTDTLLSASFEISTVSGDIPKFSTTGMTIEFEGYKTEHYVRWSSDTECINVYAKLDEPVTSDESIKLLLRNGENSQVLLENAPVEYSAGNTAVFADHDPDADYVVDTVTMTNTTISLTGHFQKEFSDYNTELDASGKYAMGDSIFWPLYDERMEDFDPKLAKEDLEGYLTIREVTDEGSFTLEWAMTKGIPGFGTLYFNGQKYNIPEPEATVEPAEYVPVLTTSAETQDYRFTLESIAATSNVIYAIMDMEPITEYGRNHMEPGPQELCIVLGNVTSPISGTTGSVLLESDENMSRYLVYSLGSGDRSYAPGDLISFDILSIFEEGDTADHNYHLFDVELEQVVTVSAEAKQISDGGDGLVKFEKVVVTPFSLYLQGIYDANADTGERHPSDLASEKPEITLTFKDGSSANLMDKDWQPNQDLDALGSYGIAASEQRGGDGVTHQTYLFSQLISLEEMDTIIINGTTYQVIYEIA